MRRKVEAAPRDVPRGATPSFLAHRGGRNAALVAARMMATLPLPVRLIECAPRKRPPMIPTRIAIAVLITVSSSVNQAPSAPAIRRHR